MRHNKWLVFKSVLFGVVCLIGCLVTYFSITSFVKMIFNDDGVWVVMFFMNLFSCIMCLLSNWSWNTLPSLFWRFKEEHELKIVELDNKFSIQIKIFGLWYYVAAPERDDVQITLFPSLAIWGGNYAVSYSAHAKELKNLETYLKHVQRRSLPEVMKRGKIVKGRIV